MNASSAAVCVGENERARLVAFVYICAVTDCSNRLCNVSCAFNSFSFETRASEEEMNLVKMLAVDPRFQRRLTLV